MLFCDKSLQKDNVYNITLRYKLLLFEAVIINSMILKVL